MSNDPFFHDLLALAEFPVNDILCPIILGLRISVSFPDSRMLLTVNDDCSRKLTDDRLVEMNL